MKQFNTFFFDCRFAQAVWSMIHAALGLSQPCSVSNMFGSWQWGLEKDLKPLILLGAAATCSSLWLCRNDIIFSTFPLQVIYSIIHLLCTWAILQRPTSQDLVAAASLRLAQVVKEFFTQAHGWRSSL
jgi:hypothetical protein